MGRTIRQIKSRVLSSLENVRRRRMPTAQSAALLLNRFARLRRRFHAFAAQVEAGALPPDRPKSPKNAHPAEPAARPRKPRLLINEGWLADAFPEHARIGPFLAFALTFDPRLKALTDASPQANRLLRSIFRATATPAPAILKPLRAKRPSRPKRPTPEILPEPAPAVAPAAATPAPLAKPSRPPPTKPRRPFGRPAPKRRPARRARDPLFFRPPEAPNPHTFILLRYGNM
jgi:hypothetical protein